MANHKYTEIAKMFGLELEEDFHVTNFLSSFRFTSKGLVASTLCMSKEVEDKTLLRLLSGELKVVRPPYRPNRGDRYFSYADFSWDIRCFGWDNLPLDYARLEAGMVFRTQDEARKELPSVYKKVTGKDW